MKVFFTSVLIYNHVIMICAKSFISHSNTTLASAKWGPYTEKWEKKEREVKERNAVIFWKGKMKFKVRLEN